MALGVARKGWPDGLIRGYESRVEYILSHCCAVPSHRMFMLCKEGEGAEGCVVLSCRRGRRARSQRGRQGRASSRGGERGDVEGVEMAAKVV